MHNVQTVAEMIDALTQLCDDMGTDPESTYLVTRADGTTNLTTTWDLSAYDNILSDGSVCKDIFIEEV